MSGALQLELASVLAVSVSVVAQELIMSEPLLLLLLLIAMTRSLSAATPVSEPPNNTSRPLHTTHSCA